MRRGPQPGKVFNLEGEIVTVGSGMKNGIVIQDNDVSREHCRLIRVMADYELHDLNSVRGTFVSGQRLKAGWLLKPGNVIELGDNVTLEYERAPAPVELTKLATQSAPKHIGKPTAQSHPYLVSTGGMKIGEVFPLESETVRIGREQSNDIIVSNSAISRLHVILRWKDNAYEIEDQGSTNGTALNGNVLQPKVPQPIHSNDVINVAATIELRFTWQPDDVKNESEEEKKAARPSTKEFLQRETAESNLITAPTPTASKRQTSKLGTGLQQGALIDHVFITYARPEWQSIIVPMMALMQDAGLKVWVDQYLIQGGDDWMIAVEQALSECKLLVVVVSPEALESRYTRLAYRYFFNREKPIVPVLYAPVDDMPLELKKHQVVKYNSADRKKTFDELITEVKRLKE
jgi:pSer/pThr/pTyr-binding forkhead associated (FHA) protein